MLSTLRAPNANGRLSVRRWQPAIHTNAGSSLSATAMVHRTAATHLAATNAALRRVLAKASSVEVVDALPVLESSLVTAQPDTAVLPASSDSPKQQANNKKRRNRTRRSKSKTAVAQAAAQEAGADVSDVVAVADIASAVANAISASGVTQAFDAVVNNIVARQIKALTPAGQSADPQMRQLFTDLQGKIDTIQAQLEQVSAERDLLKTVLKEELGINDLSKYQEGASKDALGAQYLQLLHVPELAAAYAKEASDLQQEKPDAARAVRLADLIVRAAFQLFPGDGLAEKLARCLLLDAAEAVAETGKDDGDVMPQLEIPLAETSSMLLEYVKDHSELEKAAAAGSAQAKITELLRQLAGKHSWAGLVTRRGEECLQLRLQDLLLVTLFSKEQLALYIKAVYAVQADNDDALAKGLLALHMLTAGLQFLDLKQSFWVEMVQGEEAKFRDVILQEQRNLFTDGDVVGLYSLDKDYMGDTVKNIFCRNTYDGPDGEERYYKAHGDEMWAFNTWGEVQLDLYHLVAYGQAALGELEPATRRAVTRKQGSLLRASALHPEGFADAVKRVLYAKGVDGW